MNVLKEVINYKSERNKYYITRNSSKIDGQYRQLLSVDNTNGFSVGKIK